MFLRSASLGKKLQTLGYLITILAVMALTAPVASAQTINLGAGAPDYAGNQALLSDFQQAYGQVWAQLITVPSDVAITNLTVWGTYYNYRDLNINPPAQDDFTLRLHAYNGGDPLESILLETSLGAGVRADTGMDFLGENGTQYPLDIYSYTFDGLDIPVTQGVYLVSIINNTVNPGVDGYWHWVTQSDQTGESWWRRENAEDFFTPGDGYYETKDWTPYNRDMAMDMTAASGTPEPGTMLLFGSAAGALGWLRRRKARK